MAMVFKLRARAWLVLLGTTLLFWLVQPLPGQPAPSGYVALKGEMRVMEAVIDETLSQTFTPPFGLLEKTKGAYLPDFGLVFSLEVNLYPLRAPNPFDMRPLTKAELEKAAKAKRQRIEVIKKSVPRLLADHGSSLRDVNSQESVAVIVHLFHIPVEGEALPTEVIVEVKKTDLDQYLGKKLSYEQLLEKVKTLEL
jgi:hypothetical protein